MKHIKRLCYLLLFVFMIPFVVHAAESSVSLDGDEIASSNSEISIDIVLNSDVAINEFKGIFTYESQALELLSIENKNDWKQESKFEKESPISFDFKHGNGVTGSTIVATLKFKVRSDIAKESTLMSIEGSVVIEEDSTINPVEKLDKIIEIKSRDNSLKSLKLNGNSITNFSPTTYSYLEPVKSTVTTANFEAELNDNTAHFKNGYEPPVGVPLEYGDNVFEIVVVSATEEEKKYVVTITRPDNRETNNNLKSIIINGNPKLIQFDKDTLNYSITTHKLSKIEIAAEAENPKATINIEKPDELPIGVSTIKINVISEKQEAKVYTITVNNSDKEIDTSLASLEILGIDDEFVFNSDKYDYEILYKEKYKDTLVINPKANNPDEATIDKAKYENDIKNLGPNKKVNIVVKAKDGTEGADTTYTITFKKDTRINFFLLLGLTILIVLLIIFISLKLKNKKRKKEIEEKKEEELVKTKRLERVNLE